MISVNCHICGKPFSTWPYVIKSGNGKYCSTPCRRLGVAESLHQYALNQRMHPRKQPRGHRVVAVRPAGATTQVSTADFDWAKGFAWKILPNGYIQTSRERLMHREIMARKLGRELEAHEEVDHKDRIRSNNRRSNLRLCTRYLNAANRGLSTKNSSGYKGVSLCAQTGRWRASMTIEGRRISIGYFDTALEAAFVRDQFALQLFGDFAYLNVLK